MRAFSYLEVTVHRKCTCTKITSRADAMISVCISYFHLAYCHPATFITSGHLGNPLLDSVASYVNYFNCHALKQLGILYVCTDIEYSYDYATQNVVIFVTTHEIF